MYVLVAREGGGAIERIVDEFWSFSHILEMSEIDTLPPSPHRKSSRSPENLTFAGLHGVLRRAQQIFRSILEEES